MTPTETVRLLAIIQAATPAMRMTELTPDVWHQLLSDVPYAVAEAAVYRHTRTSSAYLSPADIRRLVAEQAGLMPPPLEEALRLAYRWASDRGRFMGGAEVVVYTVSLGDLPGPVAEVCRDLGSSFINDSPQGVWHKRFADAYRARCKREVDDLLAGDLGAHLELEAPSQRRALA